MTLDQQQQIVHILEEYETFKIGHPLCQYEIIGHALKKLGEEVGELAETLYMTQEGLGFGSEVADEIGDIGLVLCRISEYWGLDLDQCIRDKAKILVQRIKHDPDKASPRGE